MKIHKEGYTTILLVFIVLSVLLVGTVFLFSTLWISILGIIIYCVALLFFLYFFRKPMREFSIDDNKIFAPADGEVVVIEETFENEYFTGQRLQVSIFMSPLNVHINWYPISGLVKYYKYHSGKYLVAWHPKSSTDNERTTVVIKNDNIEILVRQIAGALARRIVCYAKTNTNVKQGTEIGFIKFGSRVDVFLPVGTKINVELGQKVKGLQTIIAEL